MENDYWQQRKSYVRWYWPTGQCFARPQRTWTRPQYGHP